MDPEPELCDFCPNEKATEMFVVTTSDYVDTNLGDEPPLRVVDVCLDCEQVATEAEVY